jgi:hypothetical protein
MLLAAALLDRGHDLNQVAATTGVPAALLELVRDGPTAEGGSNAGDGPAATTMNERTSVDALSASEEDRRIEQHWNWYRRRSLRARRMIIALLAVEITAVVNIVACVSALVRHNTDLGLITGVVAVALTLAVFEVSRAVTGAGANRRATSRPPPGTDEDRNTDGFPH